MCESRNRRKRKPVKDMDHDRCSLLEILVVVVWRDGCRCGWSRCRLSGSWWRTCVMVMVMMKMRIRESDGRDEGPEDHRSDENWQWMWWRRADSSERNQFKIWQLCDDWFTETTADPDWVIEEKHPQSAEFGSEDRERDKTLLMKLRSTDLHHHLLSTTYLVNVLTRFHWFHTLLTAFFKTINTHHPNTANFIGLTVRQKEIACSQLIESIYIYILNL